METMSKAEVQSLNDTMLLQWLTFLSRFRAEAIGLHHDGNGNWRVGDRRPKIEDVEDELVARGLNTAAEAATIKRKTSHEGSHNRGIW